MCGLEMMRYFIAAALQLAMSFEVVRCDLITKSKENKYKPFDYVKEIQLNLLI